MKRKAVIMCLLGISLCLSGCTDANYEVENIKNEVNTKKEEVSTKNDNDFDLLDLDVDKIVMMIGDTPYKTTKQKEIKEFLNYMEKQKIELDTSEYEKVDGFTEVIVYYKNGSSNSLILKAGGMSYKGKRYTVKNYDEMLSRIRNLVGVDE